MACSIGTRATIRRTSSNRWLRSAHLLDVPIVYFVGTRSNWYRPIYPTFVEQDIPSERRVLLTFGKMRGPYDEREPVHIPDEIERRYVVREVKQRIHQAQFRGAVLPAYSDRCAICRLREVRLLDAAHIVGDLEEAGEPVVSNGLACCSIHDRPSTKTCVGIAPDLRVHGSRRRRSKTSDGPMLAVLKGFHGATIDAPYSALSAPGSERLALRFAAVRRRCVASRRRYLATGPLGTPGLQRPRAGALPLPRSGRRSSLAPGPPRSETPTVPRSAYSSSSRRRRRGSRPRLPG